MPTLLNFSARALTLENQTSNAIQIANLVRKLFPPSTPPTAASEQRRKVLSRLMTTLLTSFVNEKNLVLSSVATNMPSFFYEFDSPMEKLFKEVRSCHTTEDLENLERKIANLSNNEKYHAILRHQGPGIPDLSDQDIDDLIHANFLDRLIQQDEQTLDPENFTSAVTQLKNRGYITSGLEFSTADIEDALANYAKELKDVPVTVITKELFLFSDESAVINTYKATLLSAINEAATQAKSKDQFILMPINNGAGHFVFVKIKIAEKGAMEVTLTDSLSTDNKKSRHYQNNIMIIKNIHKIANTTPFPSDEALEKAVTYEKTQSSTAATCSFYAVREVVRAVEAETLRASDKKDSHPTTELAIAAQKKDADITDFQLAMIKEIARKKYPAVKELQQLQKDKSGTIHTQSQTPDYERYLRISKKEANELKSHFISDAGVKMKGPYPGMAPAPPSTPATSPGIAPPPMSSTSTPPAASAPTPAAHVARPAVKVKSRPDPSATAAPVSSAVELVPPPLPKRPAELKTADQSEIGTDLLIAMRNYIKAMKHPPIMLDQKYGLLGEDDKNESLENSRQAIVQHNKEQVFFHLGLIVDSKAESNDKLKRIPSNELDEFIALAKNDPDILPEQASLLPLIEPVSNFIRHKDMTSDIGSASEMIFEAYAFIAEIDQRIRNNKITADQSLDFSKLIVSNNIPGLDENNFNQLVPVMVNCLKKYKPITEGDQKYIVEGAESRISQLDQQTAFLSAKKGQLEEKIKKKIIDETVGNSLIQEIKSALEKIEAARKALVEFNKRIDQEKEDKAATDRITSLKTQVPLLEPPTDKSPDDRNAAATIHYLQIMTIDSIQKGNPTREHLDRLYNDPELNHFLHRKSLEAEELKSNIEWLEPLLAQEIAVQIIREKNRIFEPEHLQPFIKDKEQLIREELKKYKDSPDIQAKIIEHWIFVMEEALKRQDLIVANLIDDALSFDPRNDLQNNWVDSDSSPASQKVKETLEDNRHKFIKPATPEEKLAGPIEEKNKQQKARSVLAKNLKEIRKIQNKIVDDMDLFSKELTSEVSKKRGNKVFQELADRYVDDMKKGRDIGTRLFPLEREEKKKEEEEAKKTGGLQFVIPIAQEKAKREVADLKEIIDDSQEILDAFNDSSKFWKIFEAYATGIYNFEWMNKLIEENQLTKLKRLDPENRNIFSPTYTILPVQHIPRYTLQLVAAIQNLEKLAEAYEHHESPEIQTQIARLDAQITNFKNILTEINKRGLEIDKKADILQLHRNIYYEVYKDTEKLFLEGRREKARNLVKPLLQTDTPCEFKDAYEKLNTLHQDYKINTTSYLIKLCRHEANVQKELDAKNPNPLKKLNNDIALLFLESIEGINTKTQYTIIDFVKNHLLKPPPAPPEEIMKFLNGISLTRLDQMKGHKLSRRFLKTIVADYLKGQADEIFRDAKVDASHPASTDTILEYLTALKAEWDTLDSALKTTDAAYEHNKNRLKLVTDAIEAIKTFKESNDLVQEIHQSLIENLQMLQDSDIPEQSKRTLDASETISTLVHGETPAPSSLIASGVFTPKDHNEFSTLCKEHFAQKKEALERDIKKENEDTKKIDKNDFIKSLSDYLKFIKEECAAKDLHQGIASEYPEKEPRNIAITKAITELAASDADVQKILNTLCDELEKDPLHESTKEAIADIKNIIQISEPCLQALAAEMKYEKDMKAFEEHEKRITLEKKLLGSDEKSTEGVRHAVMNFAYQMQMSEIFKKRHVPAADHMKKEETKTQRDEMINNWTYKGSGPTTASDLDPNGKASLAGPVSTVFPDLPDGKYNEFENKIDRELDGACIREARVGDYVQITLTAKPNDYDKLSPEDQTKVDMSIADTMVRRWVKSHGNSIEERVPISEASKADAGIMKAMIIVCKAHNLKFRLPADSKHDFAKNHDSLDKGTSNTPPDSEYTKLKALINDGTVPRIRMINTESKEFKELEANVEKLEKHYEAIKATLDSDDRREHYKDQIEKLKSLLNDAKTGNISAASLNKLIKNVEQSIKDTTLLEKPEPPITFRRM